MRTTTVNAHYTVDELKRKIQVDNSEEVFGIEPEIPTQCPRVDGVFKKNISLLFKHVERLKELINDGKDDKINSELNKNYIDHEIEAIESYENILDNHLEELRSACDSLRQRGEGWKRLARSLFDKMPKNKTFVPTETLKKLK